MVQTSNHANAILKHKNGNHGASKWVHVVITNKVMIYSCVRKGRSLELRHDKEKEVNPKASVKQKKDFTLGKSSIIQC